MIVTTLTIQSKHMGDEQEIAKFYRELDIPQKKDDSINDANEKKFGIYDYDKKNKLTNNTELVQK